MNTLLQVENLKVVFKSGKKEITAVDGVNLHLNNAETLCLAGESGSGKTITALAVTKILGVNAEIISGSVLFEGKELLTLNERALEEVRGAKIAYIFQEPAAFLNPLYSIGNQIMEVIMLHQKKSKKEARKIALELLSRAKINEPGRTFFDYPHQLSGGMNQRVFLAMALACRPKLLIADEPTTSLDVTTECQIIQLLMDLKREYGFSLLFITHNLSIAHRIADRICVMHRGKIVEEGTRETIFNHAAHFHTRELLAAYKKIGRI